MPSDPPILTDTCLPAVHQALAQVNALIVGKQNQVTLAFVALLASGHLLIEDRPGLGKTTLALALAKTLNLPFQRLQFTADMLPSDVLGVSIPDPELGRFRLHAGPVFTHVLLADEINRAPPRTQSALLEAMAEGQVSIDGQTRNLPDPFFVIATQNPADANGAFPLPDSQLDRFTLRISMGYPDFTAERELLRGTQRRALIAAAEPILDISDVRSLRQSVPHIHASDSLLDYIQALLQASRQHASVMDGLSPRAGLALLQAARAHALLAGREHVVPDDVRAVFVPLAGHRLNSRDGRRTGNALAEDIIGSIAVD